MKDVDDIECGDKCNEYILSGSITKSATNTRGNQNNQLKGDTFHRVGRLMLERAKLVDLAHPILVPHDIKDASEALIVGVNAVAHDTIRQVSQKGIKR